MTAFDPNNNDEFFRRDWQLLQNAWFSAYKELEALDEDLSELKDLGYTVFDFDCAKWESEVAMRNELYKTFGFPDFDLSMNYLHPDAFNDWFWDLEIDGRDKVVVFRNFDKLYKMKFHDFTPEQFIKIFLDIFATTARGHLLFGCRFIVLLHVENKWSLPKFGSADIN